MAAEKVQEWIDRTRRETPKMARADFVCCGLALDCETGLGVGTELRWRISDSDSPFGGVKEKRR